MTTNRMGKNVVGLFKTKSNTNNITTTSNPTTQQATQANFIRATFIVDKELLKKIKQIAYDKRVSIKSIINTALKKYATK